MMRRSANKYLFSLLTTLFCASLPAQDNRFISDMVHISNQLSIRQTDPYKRPYIYRDEQSLIKKINPIGLLYGGSLYFYQNVISKHISADCLYSPSCSEYGKQAIRDAGILKGTLMTIDRVNRCNIIAAQDLKHYSRDPKTLRYPDPVEKCKESSVSHVE